MFLVPQRVLSAFGVEPGWHVADFGSGAGHFTHILSNQVGPSGRVYAIDIQPELLLHIQKTAEQQRQQNIHIIRGDLEEVNGIYIKDALLDAGVAANVFFQIEEKGKFLNELRRSMKPKSRILLVDWSDSFNNLGPAPEAVIPPQKAIRMFEHNGFEYARELPAGDHHYAVVFTKV